MLAGLSVLAVWVVSCWLWPPSFAVPPQPQLWLAGWLQALNHNPLVIFVVILLLRDVVQQRRRRPTPPQATSSEE